MSDDRKRCKCNKWYKAVKDGAIYYGRDGIPCIQRHGSSYYQVYYCFFCGKVL